MNKKLEWVLVGYIAFVFVQSLFFKFAGYFGEPADITVYIFQTIGTWISDDVGLPGLGAAFGSYGETVIGLAELVASVLLIIAATRFWGALLALGVMTGAIFFHVFTPLGLFPYTDLSCLEEGCPREYALFFMACGVWLSAAWLAWVRRPSDQG
ncbi:hypothetical protein KFE80_13350 [bacterium SCSIO 12696]|nr:hypothetical protein KFE80_13350 [bacterium SCSIO 12696]